MGTILLLIPMLHPAPASADLDQEEDEIGIGSVMASVPDRVAEQKRELAAGGGFSILGGISGFMGSADNVYRSPADLEKRGLAWGNWAVLQSEVRSSRGDKWITNLNWNQTQRPRYSNSNSNYGNLSSLYLRRLGGGVRVELAMEVSHKNDDATNVAGSDYLRDYSYWRSGAEATLVWRISERHMVTIEGERIIKNYGETAALRSIDWSEWALTAKYRRRFGPYRYLAFSYSSGERNYRDERAADREGIELLGYPTELHRYQSAGVSVTMPVGSKARFETRYERGAKTDLFAGYESNQTHEIAVLGAINAMERVEIRATVDQSWRRYAKMTGDAGRPLSYALLQIGMGARYRVIDSTWIFGAVDYYMRNSNKSTGLSYRGYRAASTTTGMSIFF